MKLKEDGVGVGAPTNNAGGGGVAGLPPDSPPVSPRHQPKKNRSVPNPIIADMLRRRSPVMEDQIDELYGKGSLEKIRSHHQGEANKLAQGGSKQEKKMGALGRLHRDSEERDSAIKYHHGKAKKARGLMSKLALREDTFAGATVFEVSSHTFHNAKMEKRKGKHWRTYLDECDELAEIREYANKNPGRPIVLQNRNTNEMVYVRYGKAR